MTKTAVRYSSTLCLLIAVVPLSAQVARNGSITGEVFAPAHTHIAGATRNVRNRAVLAMIIGCGLLWAEIVTVRIEDLQLREGHWILANLAGKGGVDLESKELGPPQTTAQDLFTSRAW